jgi:hypothetical protein
MRRPAKVLGRSSRCGGFTLIEIMSVIGLIVILIGGFGFALRDNAGSSLTSAQNTLGSLVGQARAQAAVYNTDVRLIIYSVRPPGGTDSVEKYLRVIQVIRNETPFATAATWVAVGSPVYLPRGIFVVPNPTSGLLASGVTWPANPAPVSSLNPGFLVPVSAAPLGTPFFGATAFYIEFKADGSLIPAVNPYIKLALTTGGFAANNLPAFNNANAVRGVLIRPNGAVSYVNEANGF